MMCRSGEPLKTIVTGGSGAIGEAVVDALSSRGDAIVNLDQTKGPRGHWIKANLADGRSVAEAVNSGVKCLGGVDVLVHTAGIFSASTFFDVEEGQFQNIINVNLLGSFRVAQAVAAHMKHKGGRILFISSIHGQYGVQGRLAYGASKAGIDAMTRAMSAELAEHHIRVNALAPGAVEAGMHADGQFRSDWARVTPAGRKVTAAEVANLAAMLTSDEASFVSGQVIRQDGGASTAQIFR